MKKKVSILVFILAVIFCIQPISAAQLQDAVDSTGAAYNITISFNANGGTGSMAAFTSPFSLAQASILK